jgi:hypothetical protein
VGREPVTRVRKIAVPGLRADPGGYAISADAKLFAAVVRDDASPDAPGRLEVYKLATGERVRQIKIDELQWAPDVRPSGFVVHGRSGQARRAVRARRPGHLPVLGRR